MNRKRHWLLIGQATAPTTHTQQKINNTKYSVLCVRRKQLAVCSVQKSKTLFRSLISLTVSLWEREREKDGRDHGKGPYHGDSAGLVAGWLASGKRRRGKPENENKDDNDRYITYIQKKIRLKVESSTKQISRNNHRQMEMRGTPNDLCDVVLYETYRHCRH